MQFHALLNSGVNDGGASPADTPQPPTAVSDDEAPPIVIDVRNDYEYERGHFRGAVPLTVGLYKVQYRGHMREEGVKVQSVGLV